VPSRRSSGSRRRNSSRRRRATTFSVSSRVAREVLALILVFLAIVSVIALFAPDPGTTSCAPAWAGGSPSRRRCWPDSR
jgi:hypothetical protein